MGHNVRRGRKSLIEKYQLLITVELLLMATSLQWPLFSVPADNKSIHWLLFLNNLLFLKNLSTTVTSLHRPISSVPKVAVLERSNCIILNFIIYYYLCLTQQSVPFPLFFFSSINFLSPFLHHSSMLQEDTRKTSGPSSWKVD